MTRVSNSVTKPLVLQHGFFEDHVRVTEKVFANILVLVFRIQDSKY